MDQEFSLGQRAATIAGLGAGILISIHHDSVQPVYLEDWTVDGRKLRFSNRYAGYSLFVSGRTATAARNRQLGLAIGGHLRVAGFTPSLHHAEKIPGEGRTLIEASVGLYRFDGLAILKRARIPAVLIEAGIIVNQDEELRLEDPAVRARLIQAISEGVRLFCQGSYSAN